MNKKKHQTTPQQIRCKIISLVQRFQKLSKEVVILPSPIRLKGIISSKTLRKIRNLTHIITGTWKKDDLDIDKYLKDCESLRKCYANLIFRTGIIQNEEDKRKLDEIPLELAKLIAQC